MNLTRIYNLDICTMYNIAAAAVMAFKFYAMEALIRAFSIRIQQYDLLLPWCVSDNTGRQEIPASFLLMFKCLEMRR